MSTTFEVWDTETGNAVGTFPSRKEALTAVDALMQSFGRDYVNDLVLLRRLGDEPATIEARGEALLALAGRLHNGRTRKPVPVAPSD